MQPCIGRRRARRYLKAEVKWGALLPARMQQPRWLSKRCRPTIPPPHRTCQHAVTRWVAPHHQAPGRQCQAGPGAVHSRAARQRGGRRCGRLCLGYSRGAQGQGEEAALQQAMNGPMKLGTVCSRRQGSRNGRQGVGRAGAGSTRGCSAVCGRAQDAHSAQPTATQIPHQSSCSQPMAPPATQIPSLTLVPCVPGCHLFSRVATARSAQSAAPPSVPAPAAPMPPSGASATSSSAPLMPPSCSALSPAEASTAGRSAASTAAHAASCSARVLLPAAAWAGAAAEPPAGALLAAAEASCCTRARQPESDRKSRCACSPGSRTA